MAMGPLARRSVAVDGPPPLPKKSHEIGEKLKVRFFKIMSAKKSYSTIFDGLIGKFVILRYDKNLFMECATYL
jgi:hypothetical protein